MEFIILTDEQKVLFHRWLVQEAESNIGIIEQAKKINVPDVFVKKMANEALACTLIAEKLHTTETQIIKE